MEDVGVAGCLWRVQEGNLWWTVLLDEPKLPECSCERCKDIAKRLAEMSREEAAETERAETARRLGELAKDMVEQAVCDVLPGWEPPRGDFPSEKVFQQVEEALDRLASLNLKQRADEREDMRTAYEWLMSDDRAVFRLVRDENGEVVTRDDNGQVVAENGRPVAKAEGYLPFLIACEALHVLPDNIRVLVRRQMEIHGLASEVVLDPTLPLKTQRRRRGICPKRQEKFETTVLAKKPAGRKRGSGIRPERQKKFERLLFERLSRKWPKLVSATTGD